MFKKSLLTLAIAGVSVAANAAVVKTSITTAVQATVEKAIEGDKSAGTALGTDGVFGGGTTDNCVALASALGVSLTPLTGKTTAAAGGAGDTATFTALSGLSTTTVEVTDDNKCTAFVAPTLGATATKDGLEFTQATALQIQPKVVAGIGGYKAEDTLTFKFAGAKLDLTKTTAPSISVGNDGIAGSSPSDVSFDVLDITEDQVRFTVKADAPATDFVKGSAILELSGLFLDSTGLSSSTAVTLTSFGTNTSGTQFDESEVATIVTLLPQYTTEVSGLLDADIDVGKDRQQFANDVKSDVLSFTTKVNPTTNLLTPATATYVITGDFSWMNTPAIDDNKDGKLSSTELGDAVSFTGTDDTIKSLALNTDYTQLTVVTTVVSSAVDLAPSLTFTVPGFDNEKGENPMIPVQTFTAKVDVTSDKSVGNKAINMAALAETGAGAWNLNGSVIVVPYMPFGPSTQPILRHTNAGTREGDISVRYMVEGEHEAWQNLDAAGVADSKPGVRNMLGLVTDALKGEGYDAATTGFKVALEIVTNVPSRDVHVYGGAKVTTQDSDRIHLGTFKTNVN